jgi:lipopolysaccharide transport system permease protein
MTTDAATEKVQPPEATQAESAAEFQRTFDLVLKPSNSWVPLRLDELWAYRELLLFLCWRDIKVRYKQTALGAAWAIIQPLFTMIIFSIFFGKLAGMGEKIGEGIPYPLFALAALVPWTFFANGLTQAADSLVTNSNLVKKVYFPRLLVPLSCILTGGVDFCLAFSLLLGMMAFYGVCPTIAVLWLPAFLLLAVMASLGVGLWLSALNVQYRDVRYTLNFLVQLWLFATPIAYPSSLITNPTLRAVYGLNPMAGVVDGFRWALLGTQSPGPMVWVSAVATALILVSGMFYFRRMEKTFADTV